jgi:serine/threonine-protein kinase
MIGTTIDHYRITEAIGHGGMGDVYKAIDLELDRVVAIKSMRRDLSHREEQATRFRAEARMLARLDHPNVATVYRFFEHEDQLFLVMEYVAGKSFGALVPKRGRGLPVDEAVPLFCQALRGIGYAHEHGVVHRDLKPSNLMYDERGLVKVLDFGIAQLVGSTRLTRTGMAVGTPAYMAPEQVRGREVDGRADIYSLGIVFYEILTGVLPYEASSDFELMRAHLESEPRDIAEITGSVPMSVQSAIRRALEKEADARFRSAADFASALRQDLAPAETALDGLHVRPARMRGRVHVWGDRVRPALLGVRARVRPESWRTAAAGVLVAALTGGLVAWALDGGSEADDGAVPAGPSLAAPDGDPRGASGTRAGPGDAGDGDAEGAPAAAAFDGAPATASARGGAGSGSEVPDATDRASIAPERAPSPADAPRAAPARSDPPPRSAPLGVPASASIADISVHGTMRASGRPAGYSAVVDVRGTGAVVVTEIIEIQQYGRQVLRETVSSQTRSAGRYRTRQRITALRTLSAGSYSVQLVIESGGRTLAQHRWPLVIR